MSENKGIAGLFVMGDGLQQGDPANTVDPLTLSVKYPTNAAMNCYVGDVPWQYIPPPPPWAQPQIPVVITTGTSTEHQVWPFTSEADLRRFIRAEVHQVLDDLVDELRQSKAFQPVTAQHTPSGTCWACGEYGKSEDMMWHGHHLIHATVECRDMAEVKPEIKEHKG